FTVASRSRLLTNALPVVGPGASVQHSVTRNGRPVLLMLPLSVYVAPVAPSTCVSSTRMREAPSKARPRFTRPMPWLFDQGVLLADTRGMFVVLLAGLAFPRAGRGVPRRLLANHRRISAAAPEMAGVEGLVPDDHAYSVWPAGQNWLHTPVPS